MHKLLALLAGLFLVVANVFAAVNVNTANESELQALTGIGPAKAKAIIDYRTKNGAFKTVDDLLKVPGIGPAVLGKMKTDVTLTGPTTSKTSAAPAAEAAKPASSPAAPSTPPTATKAPASAPAPVATQTPAAPAAKSDAAKPAASAPAPAAAASAAEKPAASPGATKGDEKKPAEKGKKDAEHGGKK